MAEDRDVQIFCENFRYLRRSRGLTQKQMAQRLQISVGYVRRIEKGEHPPRMTVEVIFQIFRVFGITPGRQFSEILSETD